LQDLEYDIERADNKEFATIFFGGGTPSLAPYSFFEKIVGRLGSAQEVTLEVNPTQITTEKLKMWKNVGINRLSLGVQALDDEVLKFFGRDHNFNDALRAIDLALSEFVNVSCDFIWGRPHQSVNDWEKELNHITSLGIPHLSLYQLTLERGTRLFSDWQHKHVELPCEDDLANMYQLCRDLTYRRGILQYEVSSYCIPGFESMHNSSYWSGLDYIGIGPGAHGRFTVNSHRVRTRRLPSPKLWGASVESLGHGIRKETPMSLNEVAHDLIVFGLRTTQGIQYDVFRSITGLDPVSFLDMEKVYELVEGDFLQQDGAFLKPTPKGIALMDRILIDILRFYLQAFVQLILQQYHEFQRAETT
jgi:oxygen-independent coproporphyrinogen-3 oxidase